MDRQKLSVALMFAKNISYGLFIVICVAMLPVKSSFAACSYVTPTGNVGEICIQCFGVIECGCCEMQITDPDEAAQDTGEIFYDDGIKDAIQNTFNPEVSDALEKNAEDISDAIDAMGTRLIEEFGKHYDGFVTFLYDQARRREKIKAARNHYYANQYACQTSSGMKTMLMTEKSMEERVKEREREMNNSLENMVGTFAENGTLAGIVNTSIKRRQLYCNPETYDKSDSSGNLLERACNVAPNDPFINADRSPFKTLFNKENLRGDVRLSALGNEAANDLIAQMIYPFVPDGVRGAGLGGSGGIKIENMRSSDIARLAVAAAPWFTAKELRYPSDVSSDWIKDMRARTMDPSLSDPSNSAFNDPNGKNLAEYIAYLPDNSSRYQIMKMLYSDRIKDPLYLHRLQAMENIQINQEITSLSALQLQLRWEQYKILEQMLLTEATRLATLVNDTRTDMGSYNKRRGGSGSRALVGGDKQ